jgi:hypothetical protein
MFSYHSTIRFEKNEAKTKDEKRNHLEIDFNDKGSSSAQKHSTFKCLIREEMAFDIRACVL